MIKGVESNVPNKWTIQTWEIGFLEYCWRVHGMVFVGVKIGPTDINIYNHLNIAKHIIYVVELKMLRE